MARFTSPSQSLILQDENGVWARFVHGQFETTDRDLVARLRKADRVSEVKKS